METKYCKRCDKFLPVDSFTKSSARKDGYQSYCREHMKAYRKEHYHANKQQYYDRNKKALAKLRQFVVDLKNSTPCFDCGVSYPGEPWLMEFDHRVPAEKLDGIQGVITRYGTMKRLQEELDKCDLVCVICHRRRTAKHFGWLDNRLAHLL